MSVYVYPSQPYDRGRNMLALLGSHWSSTYKGNEFLAGMLEARALEQAQTHLNLLEAIASLSRFEVPIYHTDLWHFLPLRRSDVTKRKLRYGDGVLYGAQPDGTVYEYGSHLRADRYYYPAPEQLRDVQLIFNRITEPSLTLTRGVDFTLADGFLIFTEDPFANDKLVQTPLYDGSTIVDYEIGLWLFRGQFDWQHTYDHFAYMLGLSLASSENYKAYVNALFDGLGQGSSLQSFETAIAALTGVPVVLEETEQVEHVETVGSTLSIVTDTHAYRFPAAATPVVAVGQAVHAGDQLVDLVKIHELQRGTLPEDVQTLVMGREFLTAGYIDGLAFQNKDVPLIVETVDGVTKVSFELGGFPADVERFWDEVHKRRVYGVSLARLLDVRGTMADTEPTAASLPATINPLQFLVDNVLRYNTVLVTIKTTQLPTTALPLETARLLRKITPPWTVVLLLLEMTASQDEATPNQAGSDTAVGTSEDPEMLLHGDADTDEISPSVSVAEWPTLSYEEGVCDQ